MTKRNLLLLFIIIYSFIFSGCCNIILGSKQKVYVNSQPSGARISIDGKNYGVTPKVISLRRKGREKEEVKTKKEYYLKLEKDGFSSYEKVINRKFHPLFFGNVLYGPSGIIGMFMDAGNGSMYRLDSKEIVATLKKNENQVSYNDSLSGNITHETDSFILKQPNQWAVGITGNYITAHVTDPAYYSGGPNTEKHFVAIGLSLTWQRSANTAYRLTHSRSFSSDISSDVITTSHIGNYPKGTVIHVKENWWANDTRLEILLRLNRLANNNFGCSIVTGLGYRAYWYKYNFDPYPATRFDTEPRKITSTNNTKEFGDGYTLILAGVKLEQRFNKIVIFIEPSIEGSFLPDILEGGGEGLKLRYRLSMGIDYKFGKKLRLKP